MAEFVNLTKGQDLPQVCFFSVLKKDNLNPLPLFLYIPEKRKKMFFFDLLRGNKKGTLGKNGLIGKLLCKTEGIRF